MENVLFKISYPAEFHAQTAVEAAHTLHATLRSMGKSSDDIASIKIRTQEAAMRIINKKGKLHNFADREYVAEIHLVLRSPYGMLVTTSIIWLPTHLFSAN